MEFVIAQNTQALSSARDVADLLHAILPAQPSYMASEHAHALIQAAKDAGIRYGMMPLDVPASAANDALVRATEALSSYVAQLEARVVEGGR